MIRDSGASSVESAHFSDRSADLGWVGLDPDVPPHIPDLRRLPSDPGLSVESAGRLASSGSVVSRSVDRFQFRKSSTFPVFEGLLSDPDLSRRNPRGRLSPWSPGRSPGYKTRFPKFFYPQSFSIRKVFLSAKFSILFGKRFFLVFE